MQAEQISKESKKDDTQEPSIKKMLKKDLSEGPKVSEQAGKQGNSINGQSSQNHQIRKESAKNEDSSSSDCIVLKHKDGFQPTVQQNTVPQSGENEEEDDDDVQIISVSNPTKQNNGIPQRKDSGSGSISKQKKKNTNRCKICKKGGSTSSFKACKDCARLFHYECVGMKKELDQQRKYFCDQCKDKQKQKRAVEREKEKKKKIKEKEKEKERQLKIESILAEAKKKFEKPKDNKKEEAQKFLEEFSVKYPQYIENKKIKFPIEDTLLTIYGEKFQDSQNLAKRPRPLESKIIPQEHINDILMIWNFLNSFSEHLENMKFTKEQLYIAIVRRLELINIQQDHKGEESHALLNHIFRNLVRFPVLDIYYTHKIDNHKELSDQPFFIITRVAKEIEQLDTIMQLIWPEFIRHLSFFQQYSINFKDDELITEIIEKMKQKDFSGFFDLNTKQRIKFMSILIACVDDSDSFHDGVIGYKQEQVHEMTKERNDLQVEIKKDELELQALDTKVKALEQTQKEQSAAILENLSRAESLKKQKELEKEKKELQKQKNQVSKLEQALNKKKNKCQQLTYDLPHYINTAQLLGYDHNKSEFWFFHNDRKTIYVRYKESIIDDDRIWCFYNNKEDITNLIKSLNKKGIREKNLYDNLIYLVKNGYLQYKFEDFEKKPSTNNVNSSNQNNSTNGNQSKETQQVGGIQTTLQFNNKNGLTITQNGETPAEEKKDMEIEEVKKPEETDNQSEGKQNGEVPQPIEEEDEVEETKEQIFQFISNYDAQAVINKTTATSNKKKATKQQQNEKELSVFQRARCNFKDVGMIILETEKNFTDYLERRKSRWANKVVRETFRERVKNTTDPQEILALLEQLNEGFSAVDHMFIKENAKVQENEEESSKIEQEENYDDNQSVVSDDDSFQGVNKNKNGKNTNPNQAEKNQFTLEYFENHPQMRSKKLPMRIWGIYSDKCKKNWQNLPMVNIMSAYLSAYIFCSIIQRFLQRKKEQQQEKALYEQNSQLPPYYVADDKKNINSSTSLNQKRKLLSISEIDNYKYTDNSLRRSDRQRYRKDLSEPNYDLEDFEEEEGQEENDQSKNKEEDEEEEFVHKSSKNKKGKKISKNEEDEEEEEYDADKIEDEDDIEESDEQQIEQEVEDEDEEENEKASKKGGKRKLTKQKDIKKKKAKDENEEDMEEEEDDEEEEEIEKKSNNKKGRGKPAKKQTKEDSEEEEEFQFFKKKDDKNDKKPKHKEVSEDEENEEEEEEELGHNKNKNIKNTKSKDKKPSKTQNKEWDEECKVCGHHGEVLMCDTCPSVFHLKCIGLKSLPEGDWSCLECQERLLKQRQTRSAVKKHKNK